ncbi:MAG TPA: right-handed parallel beta-helix repeat-containing protein [Kiritimatiellia bacterium]|nr:right-handed parallel beta-helix repeat-containing protein [Kiritimatiellia bacterium]
MKKTPISIIISLTSVLTSLAQGPLTPPGAPAPTMKTLDQIEPRTPISSLPYVIGQSGSYFVAGSLTGAPSQSGITITNDNVTVDLMGFELVGNSGLGSGITVSGTRSNIVIKNGTLRGWTNDGINMGSTSTDCRFENMNLVGNGGTGLRPGHRSIVRNCTAIHNGSSGFFAEANQTVMFIDCMAADNGSTGIGTGIESTISRCFALRNIGFGIHANGGRSTVRESTAHRNTGIGIHVGPGGEVYRCTVTSNTSHGIRVVSESRVESNHVAYNVDNGIFAMGFGNLLKNNTLVHNHIGLVTASQNLITGNMARNSLSGTNYNIAANCKVGVIVAAPNSPAIAGNSGGAGLGTTDPWANFSY